jgi:hypothetical protein
MSMAETDHVLKGLEECYTMPLVEIIGYLDRREWCVRVSSPKMERGWMAGNYGAETVGDSWGANSKARWSWENG